MIWENFQYLFLQILEPRDSPLTNIPLYNYPMYPHPHQVNSHIQSQEILDSRADNNMSPGCKDVSDMSMTLSELTDSSSLSPQNEFANNMKIYDEERRQMIVQQLEILNER